MSNSPESFQKSKRPILVIIGPSAAGKSSAIRKLQTERIIKINQTWTTRPPRPDETGRNVEHRFLSDSEFNKKEKAGFFLATVTMFGLPYRYGLRPVAPSTAHTVSVVMLRAALLPLLNQYYPDSIVYHIEDELPRIKERLLARQLHGEALGSRLNDYHEEVKTGRELATRIFINNKDVSWLASKLEQALREDFNLV